MASRSSQLRSQRIGILVRPEGGVQDWGEWFDRSTSALFIGIHGLEHSRSGYGRAAKLIAHYHIAGYDGDL
jgi:hypothetical protein